MRGVTLLVKPASGMCNMRCKYCFYADEMANRETANMGIMSYETLETLIMRAFEYADADVNIAWQGGEPTLAGLDFFKKASELVEKYNVKRVPCHFSLQTNGYNISRDMAEFFAKEKYLVGISIDGYSDLHDMHRVDASGRGTYSRIKKTTRLLDECSVEYNILTVITAAASRYGRKIFRSLTGDGFRYLQFIACLDPISGESKQYSLTPEGYGRFLCDTFDCYYEGFVSGNYVSIRDFDNLVLRAAGKPVESCAMQGHCGCYFTIEADGSVYPCDFYVFDEWCFGNVADAPLEELEKSEIAHRFVTMSDSVAEECEDCKWFPICRGGCRRNRDLGGAIGLNRFCKSYKKFYDYAYPRLMELARSIK